MIFDFAKKISSFCLSLVFIVFLAFLFSFEGQTMAYEQHGEYTSFWALPLRLPKEEPVREVKFFSIRKLLSKEAMKERLDVIAHIVNYICAWSDPYITPGIGSYRIEKNIAKASWVTVILDTPEFFSLAPKSNTFEKPHVILFPWLKCSNKEPLGNSFIVPVIGDGRIKEITVTESSKWNKLHLAYAVHDYIASNPSMLIKFDACLAVCDNLKLLVNALSKLDTPDDRWLTEEFCFMYLLWGANLLFYENIPAEDVKKLHMLHLALKAKKDLEEKHEDQQSAKNLRICLDQIVPRELSDIILRLYTAAKLQKQRSKM